MPDRNGDREPWPKEVVIPVEKPYVDARGVIQNLVEADIRMAVIITSKKGAVRANHYHKTDWHYCYVLSGSIEYFHRPAGSRAAPERVLVQAGQLFFTPPMVEHAMRFPEETVFLTLSRNARDHEAYEADVVRVQLI
ncbi:MAG: cupin domain-containing protein [Candidatus Tectomicrobia bacterium]|nr:cupin domain-containing protein [Candidatus Tectomicrobia bacterium]